MEDFWNRIPGGSKVSIEQFRKESCKGFMKKVLKLIPGVILGETLKKILKETDSFLNASMEEFLKALMIDFYFQIFRKFSGGPIGKISEEIP